MKTLRIVAVILACILPAACTEDGTAAITSIVSQNQVYMDGKYYDQDEPATIIFSYDDAGRKTGIEVWSHDSLLVSNQSLSYDDLGRLCTESYYERGKLSAAYSYSYDGQNKTEVMLGPDGGTIALNEIRMNRKGLDISSVQTFLTTGNTKNTEYRYWPSGKIKEVRSHTEFAEIESNFEDEYSRFDRHGNQLSYHMEMNAANGVQFEDERYSYVFDRYGNWTEKVVYLNDSIVGRFCRIINYRKQN